MEVRLILHLGAHTTLKLTPYCAPAHSPEEPESPFQISVNAKNLWSRPVEPGESGLTFPVEHRPRLVFESNFVLGTKASGV